MSESQDQLLTRMVAEAVEARKHTCEKCGHDGGEHAFDIFPIRKGDNPCRMSCRICMDNETERLKKK